MPGSMTHITGIRTGIQFFSRNTTMRPLVGTRAVIIRRLTPGKRVTTPHNRRLLKLNNIRRIRIMPNGTKVRHLQKRVIGFRILLFHRLRTIRRTPHRNSRIKTVRGNTNVNMRVPQQRRRVIISRRRSFTKKVLSTGITNNKRTYPKRLMRNSFTIFS